MTKVGVLGLQGAVREHVRALENAGAEVVVVKKVEQLADLDGLVMPGGESTTMRRLIDKYNFFEPLKAFGQEKPVFGTCAGMILMADKIEGQDDSHLGFMDMHVRRNAFGRQVDSFEAELMIKDVADDFVGVFIRAPFVLDVGPDVEILCKYNDSIVAARQGHFIAASFHPELTDDYRFHEYFVKLIEEYK